MAQREAAAALANILNKVARYSVILGIGGSALQASLYTGALVDASSSEPQPSAASLAPFETVIKPDQS
jgi:hypothetical protein